MSTLRFFACFVVIALALVAATAAFASPAPTTKLAPAIPCTSANRMDIFVDEDNILWECQCQWLKSMPICHWQQIGGVDAVRIRRKIQLHQLPPRFYYYARSRRLVVI